jgi:hypothetical protein
VTPSWLTAALTEAGLLTRGEVASARTQRVGQERGFTGVIGKVTLDYANADGTPPPSLIAKLPMAENGAVSGYRAAQQADPALARRYYERCVREERFYRDVGAAFAPARYYSAVDDARKRVVLLLEDVSAGRPGDVLRGCSADEAALVLETVAPFHAARSQPRSFPRWADSLETRQERYPRQADVFLQRYGGHLPADLRETVERLRAQLGDVLSDLAERPQTLIHADFHLDNIILDARPTGEPVVLDWQTACIGPAALDVATFLFGSLNVDERRGAEAALLRSYSEHMPWYAVDELRHDCRLALVSLLAGTVGWLARPDLGELTGRERALADAALGDGRLLAALRDHEVADLVGR